jgi:hypothetical protein
VYTYSVAPALIGGDTFTGTLSRVVGENIGTFAITQGTLSAGTNYNITFASNNFTITAKPITVTATAGQSKIYGAANPVCTYSVAPALIGGDTFTGTLSRVVGENIGTYAITQGTLSAGTNYTITYVSNNFTITAKPITVTATAGQSKVYGAANPAYIYSVAPALIGSDAFTGALSRVAGENIGTYAITQGTLSAGTNYTITFASNSFTITAKPLTVTGAIAQDKVYNGNNVAAITGAILVGVVLPDDVTLANQTTGTFAQTGVGTNIVVATLPMAITGAGIGNYTLTQPTGLKANITARSLEITATAGQSKKVGEPDPVFAYTITNGTLVTGDALTGALTRAAGETAGNYAIQIGSLSAGANYNISFVSNDFTISLATSAESLAVNLFKVYPNPAKDNLTISSDAIITNIIICNSKGQIVKSYKKQTANQVILDISDLASGVYFLKVTSGGNIVTRSIIKK